VDINFSILSDLKILTILIGLGLGGLDARPTFTEAQGLPSKSSDGYWVEDVSKTEREAPVRSTKVRHGLEKREAAFGVDEETVTIRLKFNIFANADGSAKFLEWGSLELGVQRLDGTLSLLITDSSAESWYETEFILDGSNVSGWRVLDVARVLTEGKTYDMVFIDGKLIATHEYSGQFAGSEYKLFQSEFASVAFSKAEQSQEYTGMVLRGLRNLGLKADERKALLGESRTGNIKQPFPRFEVPSDEVRKQLSPGGFTQVIRAGDLTLSEEVWFMTQTVNRSYFEYGPFGDLEDLPFLENMLNKVSSDTLPTLESRGIQGSVEYENFGDRYIEKLYGFLMAEQSGDYTFHLSGDESAILFMSPDTDSQKIVEISRLEQATARYDWSHSESNTVSLEAFVPVYFEVWHVETTGNDHFAIGWSSNSKPIELIPSSVLTSHAAGIPGILDRRISIPDESQLTPEDEMLSMSEIISTSMSLAGPYDHIDGTQDILLSDFSADNYRFHAYQSGEQGLGWVFSDSANWPNINDMASGSVEGLGWLWYDDETSNPQHFYDHNMSVWFDYFHTPYPRIRYDGETLPMKWDFESGLVNWFNVTSGDDDYNWSYDAAGTPSYGTGPNVDNTQQTSTGKYLFLETSSGSGAYSSGDEAHLISHLIYVEPDNTTLHFYYHMHGSDIGTLQIDCWSDGNWTNNVWSVTGQQQNNQTDPYLRADVPILSTFADRLIRIRIKAIAAGGYRGDIAFDDIIVYIDGADSDGDGLNDDIEMLTHYSDPLQQDTDLDGWKSPITC